MISIPYQRSNGVFTFTGTLVLEDDVYNAMTPEEIKAMQDEKFASWLTYIQEASVSDPGVE